MATKKKSPSTEESRSMSRAQARRTARKRAREAAKKANDSKELLTLSEVSRLSGISMPTLQRYKKEYQSRIPSVGEGRKQRYPRESLKVFTQLKEENVARRGRPRKAASPAPAPKVDRRRGRRAAAPAAKKATKRAAPKGRRVSAKAAPAKANQDLLPLSRIAEITKISYPTLMRYVSLYLDRIPHEGTGRTRRYQPEAVAVFRQIRSESRRGRAASAPAKKAAGPGRRVSKARKAAPKRVASAAPSGSVDTRVLSKRIEALEKGQARIQRELDSIARLLRRPLRITVAPR